MSLFFSNEFVSLEKRVEINATHGKTKRENLDETYDIKKCAKWITDNDYKNICAQFPDQLLTDSCSVANRIEELTDRRVFIVGDTAYESCCVDFTSAQHFESDAIIHFGHTCFSSSEETIPYLRIHQKHHLDTSEFFKSLQKQFVQNVTILIDAEYYHKLDDLTELLKDTKYEIKRLDDHDAVVENQIYLYLGANDRKLINIKFALNANELFACNPNESYEISKYELDPKILKRRYFLTEKIKDSNVIGIVIVTLAVKNYLAVMERLKALIKLHNKKYYIMAVGRPTVEKLANFPEVDVYVVISCALNHIYESRDFYKPIVTPFDVEAALNPRHDDSINFSYDYNVFLTKTAEITDELRDEIVESDVSLLTGNVRTKDENDGGDSKEIIPRPDGKLALNTSHGGGYLSSRTWQGLEQNLGGDEPKVAEKGRSGIAYGYNNEKD